MEVFEIVIALLLGGVVLAAVARRIATPYPALVAIAGAALALFPRIPSLVLDPELALALFVAPVLLDAAFDASQRDLRENWRAVTSLAFGAVVLTVLVVAVVAHALVPGLPWAAAVFTSFAVVLVTLVVQGMTLRPLLAWLDLRDDGTVEREVQLARVETLRAALEATRTCGGGESAELLRRRYELRLRHAEENTRDDAHDAR